MRHGIAYGLAFTLADVEVLPLHCRRGMLHHIPWPAQRQGVHQRVRAEQLVDMRFAFMEVVVVGHEIDLVRPIGIVHAALIGGDHEIGGERLIGADLGDGVAFGLVEVEQHIVAEPFEIQFLTRVHHGVGAHETRDEHLVEAVHLLPPERGAPGGVERFDGAVFALAPGAEGVERVVAVIVAVVPAVFVAHMPCGDIGVGAVAFGKLAAQRERIFLEYRAGGAPRLS